MIDHKNQEFEIIKECLKTQMIKTDPDTDLLRKKESKD